MIPGLDVQLDHIVTIDFETYYDEEYTLSKLTTEAYVRDPRFEVIGVGVRIDGGEAVWTSEAQFRAWAATVNWSRVAVLAHHTHFDGLILAHHYGIIPGFWLDTLSMGRALHGVGVSVKLASLAPMYGAGEKGHEVENAKGLHSPWWDGKVPAGLRDAVPADEYEAAERAYLKGGRMSWEQWLAYGVYCCNDADLTRRILDLMIAKGFPEQELWLIDTTIRMYTEPTFVIDEPMLLEYLAWERARKEELLVRVAGRKTAGPMTAEELAAVRKTLRNGDKLAELLRLEGVDTSEMRKPSPSHECEDAQGRGKCAPCQVCGRPEVKHVDAKCTGFIGPAAYDCPKLMTWAFAKTDPEMQDLLESPRDRVRWLAEARIASMSNLNETRTERFINAGRRGRVPFYLKYAAAHTFRWGGGDRTNPQNLERVSDTNPRKGVIRKALKAPEGDRLVVADSNAIEARGTSWQADHTEKLRAFAEDRDLYSEFASKVYRRPVDRKRKLPDGSKPDVGPGHVGKVSELGLGYSMSWAKFALTLLAGPMGADPIQFTHEDAEAFGVSVNGFKQNKYKMTRLEELPTRLDREAFIAHCACCDYIVQLWRRENKQIVESWGEKDLVLKAMVDGLEATFGPGDCLRTVRHGIVLPSGLTMRYPGLRLSEDEDGRESYSYMGGPAGKKRTRVYGGLIVENIVQALSRDIIAEQALRVRAAGIHVATTTHDEIVARVPAADADAALETMLDIMKTPPDWAIGWPLKAEGGVAENYGAAK